MTVVDLVIVGAGAAGQVAAIQAARARPDMKILMLDSRREPGAKILVSGGGRCNIGNSSVSAKDFQGGSRSFIAQVLQAFPPRDVRPFFLDLGLPLVEEAHGRLYPASQRAADVRDALRRGCQREGVNTRFGVCVEALSRLDGHWQATCSGGQIVARRVILATGGCSLPKSGSDGRFFSVLRSLGLGLSTPFTPALSPLRLPQGHPLLELAGVATEAVVRVQGQRGRWCNQLLITHFGLSGPVVLDASRHLLQAESAGTWPPLVVDWLPRMDAGQLDGRLAAPMGARRLGSLLTEWLPQRLARCHLERAGLAHDFPLAQLDRVRRRKLVALLKEDALPVCGARSWHHAECTAGGLALEELEARTLELRACSGLHACGEMLDVDGRLGGFNFHWAWASATVAGRGAAAEGAPAF